MTLDLEALIMQLARTNELITTERMNYLSNVFANKIEHNKPY